MKQSVIIYFILGTVLFLVSCAPEPGTGNGTAVNCGAYIHDSWYDTDNDGISNNTEINNRNAGYHPNFEPDSTCNADPSEAVGTGCSGSLNGGINLKDRGEGYEHYYGTDPTDFDDWGTLKLINCIELTGRDWGDFEPLMRTGDMSKRNGGNWSPDHSCHQNGLEVDVRYIRKNNYSNSLDITISPSDYDTTYTRYLMGHLISNCNVNKIFVNLDYLGFNNDILSSDLGMTGTWLVHDGSGVHDNHFHVRLGN